MFHGIHIFLSHIFYNIHKVLDKYIFLLELTDEMLTEISYVQISQYRTKVMKKLIDKPKIPSKIAADTGIKLNHISNVLNQLKENNLKRILFCGTGALLSPTSTQQGLTIPGICHAVSITGV